MNQNILDREKPLTLVFPHPLTGPETLSGSAFLYFSDNPIVLVSPPWIIDEARSSIKLFELLQKRQPAWGPLLLYSFQLFNEQLKRSTEFFRLLEPLKTKHFSLLGIIYDADIKAFNEAAELAETSYLGYDAISQLIEPTNSAVELIRHIMSHVYLEMNKDLNSLYDYCETLFTTNTPVEFSTKAYLLRFQKFNQIFKLGDKLLLTNEGLGTFLSSLPVEYSGDKDKELDSELISWEIFRAIISPEIDPLDESRVNIISTLLVERIEEVDRLKLKCKSLAFDLLTINKEITIALISNMVESKIKTEIQDLLQLDKNSTKKFISDILSDEKSWIAVASFISGLTTGLSHLTVGSAVAALSFVGAKAIKTASEKQKKLRENSYSLVYSIHKKLD